MPETFLSIDALLERMVARSASDLHVTVGTPPAMRVNGALERYQDVPDLSPEDTHQMLYRILSTEQQKVLEINRQIDFAHSIPGLARFRVNVFFQRGTLGAAFRLIPADIKTLEELGIPTALHALTEKPRGLVLVTGPTGSGKSTDRKSTRLNSSHPSISYAVFCLKKKTNVLYHPGPGRVQYGGRR